jgi:hypothetical protein
MLTKVRLAAAAGLMALTTLLGSATAARADYWVYVPRTVYVTQYDCYGNPYAVAYTVYVWVSVHTDCGY